MIAAASQVKTERVSGVKQNIAAGGDEQGGAPSEELDEQPPHHRAEDRLAGDEGEHAVTDQLSGARWASSHMTVKPMGSKWPEKRTRVRCPQLSGFSTARALSM